MAEKQALGRPHISLWTTKILYSSRLRVYMTEAKTGRIHLKLPTSAETLLRAQAFAKFGLRKGSLQKYVLYCLLMTLRMEKVLDGNLGMKKQVMPVIMHELERHFSSTQG